MQAVSIKLPDELLGRSTILAKSLAITRSDLIRQALEHEIARLEKHQIQQQLVKASKALASSHKETEAEPWIGLDTSLGIEEEAVWWKTQ